MNADVPLLSLDGPIATITLRRPAQANRLTSEDVEHFTALLNQVNEDPDILVLMLRSTGKYFCSGYDIGSIGADRPVDFPGMVDALEQLRPVTIAVLHGGVYGGATDLALACDFRVGAEGIDMFMPAARLGLHYYQSGLERYVARLGLDQAKRLFLTAEKIDAQQMKAIGYLTDLVAADRLDEWVTQLARACSTMAPIPLLGMKKHLNCIARGVLDVDALNADMRRAIHSDDLREGQMAWAQKRTPRFTGK
jgi:enoyl-CoA hydratase/carnithine racemase